MDGEFHSACHKAGGGETNDGADNTEYVIDAIVPIEAGKGCLRPGEVDLTRVTCTVTIAADDPPIMSAELRDMDDAVDTRTQGEQFAHGGPGDDLMAGAYAAVRQPGT